MENHNLIKSRASQGHDQKISSLKKLFPFIFFKKEKKKKEKEKEKKKKKKKKK